MTDDETLRALRVSADYQFGAGVGNVLFPPDEPITVRHSSGGRPRQVLAGDVDETPGSPAGDRLVTYGTDGRFTLGQTGARRVQAALSPPSSRVVVGDESEPYVRDGRNAFAKFVVDECDRPLAVGRAELSGAEALAFDSGAAVKVRHGFDAA